MFGIAREKWQRKLLPALAVALAVLAVAWLGTATDAAPTVASGAEATAATAPANSARAPSTEAVQPDRLTPNQRVDALFNQRFKPGAPGAAVLVARDGKILLEKSYGLADAESHTPIGPTTKFRIGSITKQFTAAAILKLVDEGKLSLEDKLARFIPDYPRGQEVSIHHLLSHTSGIPNFTSKWSFIFNVTQAVEPEEQIASFKRDPYDFDPGARWAYSNSGYFLLGYIVQKVSQRTYEEYLRKTFFEPLGMPDTGVHRAGAALKNEALGYAFHGDTFKRATDWNMSRAAAPAHSIRPCAISIAGTRRYSTTASSSPPRSPMPSPPCGQGKMTHQNPRTRATATAGSLAGSATAARSPTVGDCRASSAT